MYFYFGMKAALGAAAAVTGAGALVYILLRSRKRQRDPGKKDDLIINSEENVATCSEIKPRLVKGSNDISSDSKDCKDVLDKNSQYENLNGHLPTSSKNSEINLDYVSGSKNENDGMEIKNISIVPITEICSENHPHVGLGQATAPSALSLHPETSESSISLNNCDGIVTDDLVDKSKMLDSMTSENYNLQQANTINDQVVESEKIGIKKVLAMSVKSSDGIMPDDGLKSSFATVGLKDTESNVLCTNIEDGTISNCTFSEKSSAKQGLVEVQIMAGLQSRVTKEESCSSPLRRMSEDKDISLQAYPECEIVSTVVLSPNEEDNARESNFPKILFKKSLKFTSAGNKEAVLSYLPQEKATSTISYQEKECVVQENKSLVICQEEPPVISSHSDIIEFTFSSDLTKKETSALSSSVIVKDQFSLDRDKLISLNQDASCSEFLSPSYEETSLSSSLGQDEQTTLSCSLNQEDDSGISFSIASGEQAGHSSSLDLDEQAVHSSSLDLDEQAGLSSSLDVVPALSLGLNKEKGFAHSRSMAQEESSTLSQREGNNVLPSLVQDEESTNSSSLVQDEESTNSSSLVQDEESTNSSSLVQDEESTNSSSLVQDEESTNSSSLVQDEESTNSSSLVQDEESTNSSCLVQDEKSANSSSLVQDEEFTNSSSLVQDEESTNSSSLVQDEESTNSSSLVQDEESTNSSSLVQDEESTYSSKLIQEEGPTTICSAQEEGSTTIYSAQEGGPTTICSAQEGGPTTICSAQEGGPTTICSAQEGGPTTICSAQEGGPTTICSAQEGGPTTICSAQEGGPTTICSAQEGGPTTICSAQEEGSTTICSAQEGGPTTICSAQEGGPTTICLAQEELPTTMCSAQEVRFTSCSLTEDEIVLSYGLVQEESSSLVCNLVQESMPSSGMTQEEPMPSSVMTQEESMPSSGMIQEESLPSSDKVLRESMPSSGMTQEESMPSSGMTQEESMPSSGMTQEESTSSSGMIQEESMPSSSMIQDESKPSSGMIQEESMPSSDKVLGESMPSTDMTQEESMPSSGMTQEESMPSSEMTQEESMPSSGMIKEESLPSSDKVLRESMPSSGMTQEESMPSSGMTQEESMPSSGMTHEESMPSSGMTHEESMPSSDKVLEESMPSSGMVNEGRSDRICISVQKKSSSVSCLALEEGSTHSSSMVKEEQSAISGNLAEDQESKVLPITSLKCEELDETQVEKGATIAQEKPEKHCEKLVDIENIDSYKGLAQHRENINESESSKCLVKETVTIEKKCPSEPEQKICKKETQKAADKRQNINAGTNTKENSTGTEESSESSNQKSRESDTTGTKKLGESSSSSKKTGMSGRSSNIKEHFQNNTVDSAASDLDENLGSDPSSWKSLDSGEGSSTIEPNTWFNPSTFPISSHEQYVFYEFEIPQTLVGRLIGRKGAFVNKIKAATDATIIVYPHQNRRLKLCSVEGSKQQVRAALDMIREYFPLNRYPEITLQQVFQQQPAPSQHQPALNTQAMHIELTAGVVVEVRVSAVVSASELWVQQPLHPSYSALHRLQACMNRNYGDGSDTPLLPSPVTDGIVCVAQIKGQWMRCQVLSTKADVSLVLLLDIGGTTSIKTSLLRQVRYDYMTLPFQATQCFLHGVQPVTDGVWDDTSAAVMEELVSDTILFANVVSFTEDGVPLVNLYRRDHNQYVHLNEKLVLLGHAEWMAPQPSG